MQLARNVELKARLNNLAAAQEIARRLATEYLGVFAQVDTYFHSPQGRLKLRETDSAAAQLVWYERADNLEAKRSEYLLVEAPDPNRLKQALAAAMGVRIVVSKRREVFLHHHVRIHLDEVQGLGTFLEFEAVQSGSGNDDADRATLAALQAEFGIVAADLLAVSYADLLSVKTA